MPVNGRDRNGLLLFGRNIMSATTPITASATKTSGCDLESTPTIDGRPGIAGNDHFLYTRILGSGPCARALDAPDRVLPRFARRVRLGIRVLRRVSARARGALVHDRRGVGVSRKTRALRLPRGGQPLGALGARMGAALDAAGGGESLELVVAMRLSHGDLRNLRPGIDIGRFARGVEPILSRAPGPLSGGRAA
jgi:hypothetical protein